MTISIKTSASLSLAILQWCDENNISLWQIKNLILRLKEVPGNASFKESMFLLSKHIDKISK